MTAAGTTPDMPEILEAFWDGRIADVFTALPAKVKAYDSATQTADLELIVKAPRAVDDEPVEHEALPVVPNVRVIFPSATGVAITFPIAVGDTCIFVVSSVAFAQSRQAGITSDAVLLHRNSLTCGGWAFPCAFVDTDTLSSAAEDAICLEHPSKIMIGAAATQKIARADLVDSRLDAIENWLATHTHTGVTTGPGSTGTPPPGAPVGSSTAADKGYVE